MTIIQTNIPGVLIIEPRVFNDSRGYFFESFYQREFDEKVAPILGHRVNFVQDNESKSSYTNVKFYHPEADGGINIKDESLGIDLRIPVDKAILSEKDLKHACLKDAVLDFDINDKLY